MDVIDRSQYLRVTETLYPFSGLAMVDPEVLSHAADRGTRVHKICEAIMSGLGEMGVDDETWGYVESFKKWWGEGRDVIALEERFFDDELCLTGQVDIIYRKPCGKLVIADLKTCASPSKTWLAQGCAYAYLAKNDGYEINNIEFIHLNKHGKEASVIEYIYDEDFFFAVLTTFLHFFAKG